MKKTLLFLALPALGWLLLPQELSAQVPQLFNYQGIARDAGGNVLPGRTIGVELSVLEGGPTGTVAYQETFTETTNAFGLFSMGVGGGTVVSGTFAGINWATGNKYLQTAIDLTGGTNYTLSGTTQLLSVPYALYAQNAVLGIPNGWTLNGNAGAADTNFVGTTDNSRLFFRVNDSVSGAIDPIGDNTVLGYVAGKNMFTIAGNEIIPLATENTAVGGKALYGGSRATATVAIGYKALYNDAAGTDDVGIGEGAMSNYAAGLSNVAVGAGALNTLTSGNYNTVIGSGADVSVDGISNGTAIGNAAIVTSSNMVQIGNTNVTVIQGQVPFTTPSDGRFKFNVREDVKGLDFILKLRPVTYQFNIRKEDDFIRGVRWGADAGGNGSAGATPVAYTEAMMVRRTGFIAQEVEKAAQRSGYDFDGLKAPKTEKEYYSLSYASFVVPLVKAVQEQEREIRRGRERIREQERQIDDLTKEVEELCRLVLAATKK